MVVFLKQKCNEKCFACRVILHVVVVVVVVVAVVVSPYHFF